MPTTLLSLSDEAAAFIRARTDKVHLRIALKNSGCAGHAYDLDYVEARKGTDMEVESHGLKLYVDAMAVLFLAGSRIEFKKSDLETGLVFHNPNVESACGCGESMIFKTPSPP